jgi:hypothetical protein
MKTITSLKFKIESNRIELVDKWKIQTQVSIRMVKTLERNTCLEVIKELVKAVAFQKRKILKFILLTVHFLVLKKKMKKNFKQEKTLLMKRQKQTKLIRKR